MSSLEIIQARMQRAMDESDDKIASLHDAVQSILDVIGELSAETQAFLAMGIGSIRDDESPLVNRIMVLSSYKIALSFFVDQWKAKAQCSRSFMFEYEGETHTVHEMWEMSAQIDVDSVTSWAQEQKDVMIQVILGSNFRTYFLMRNTEDKRNFYLETVKGGWIFHITSDEDYCWQVLETGIELLTERIREWFVAVCTDDDIYCLAEGLARKNERSYPHDMITEFQQKGLPIPMIHVMSNGSDAECFRLGTKKFFCAKVDIPGERWTHFYELAGLAAATAAAYFTHRQFYKSEKDIQRERGVCLVQEKGEYFGPQLEKKQEIRIEEKEKIDLPVEKKTPGVATQRENAFYESAGLVELREGKTVPVMHTGPAPVIMRGKEVIELDVVSGREYFISADPDTMINIVRPMQSTVCQTNIHQGITARQRMVQGGVFITFSSCLGFYCGSVSAVSIVITGNNKGYWKRQINLRDETLIVKPIQRAPLGDLLLRTLKAYPRGATLKTLVISMGRKQFREEELKVSLRDLEKEGFVEKTEESGRLFYSLIEGTKIPDVEWVYKCSHCKLRYSVDAFSPNQLAKRDKRRCRNCIGIISIKPAKQEKIDLPKKTS